MDTRCRVERILHASLAKSNGMPRERWIDFLKILGLEREAHALLKDVKSSSHLSVDRFLELIFGPKSLEFYWSKSLQLYRELSGGNAPKFATTNNLKDYFENHYREGGEFWHVDYSPTMSAEMWTWLHKPTGIQVWQDAIDLTSGHGGEVYFHYTSELAFRNITHPAKEAAEIWASLKTDGPSANAWWGKGIYTVPSPPDQWESSEQVLDNNFRNMMRRDREDPAKGVDYVDREYPKRAAFCVPILIDACNAFDVSKKATPEMEAAGKEPGRNLADKLLNEPGMPPRSCVVLRVSGEDGVRHARSRLLDALRARAQATADPVARFRLGNVLHHQGLYEEALPLLKELFTSSESAYGSDCQFTLACAENLASLMSDMGNSREAETLHRRTLDVMEQTRCPCYQTVFCIFNLARDLLCLSRYSEAEAMFHRALDEQTSMSGPEDPLTLQFTMGFAGALDAMGKYREAEALYRRTIEVQQKLLGHEHPETLSSTSGLAMVLRHLGNYHETERLHRSALDLQNRTLGHDHPDTLRTMLLLAEVLMQVGKNLEAEGFYRQSLDGYKRTLGPEHPFTLASISGLSCVLVELENQTEAEEMRRHVKDVCERSLGLEHEQTLNAINDLANTLSSTGKFSEAVELYRQILSVRERTLGPLHPNTLHSLANVAIALTDMGNCTEALELHRRALDRRERTLGKDNHQTLQSVSHLALTLHHAGNLREAEELQRRAVDGKERVLGPQHPSTLRSLQRLADLLDALDNPSEAVELRKRAEISEILSEPCQVDR
eukprot:s1870_g11.t1